MSIITQTVYNQRNNEIAFILKSGGVAISASEMTAITSIELKYKGTIYTSNTDFTLTKDINTAKVTLTGLGLMSAPASKDRKTELIVHAPNYPNGLVWDIFILIISDDAIP